MIDLRSDTVTQPTQAMLDVMRSATFGDDSRDGDPTVQKLEALGAEKTGKQAGVFVPSGTMSNLVAMLAHANRGGELLAEATSHIFNSELGGVSTLAGMYYRALPGARGAMILDELAAHTRARMTANKQGTSVVWVETTHNAAGGAVLPLAHMADVCKIAHAQDVPVHIDGARIFNAAAALGVDAKEICRHGDTVSFCVSKGLSAPVGSLICGSRDFIERARGFRRMVGGNMRQAGPLAAAGIVALENMVARLPEDHRTAKRLAQGLHKIDSSIVDPTAVETNLVRATVHAYGSKAADLSAALKQRGVMVSPCAAWDLRFVTHRHIGDAEVDEAISAFAAVWNKH
jgi:threonine aldolase